MNTKNYYKIKKIFLIILLKIEDRKQILKTDPDTIIKKQEKDDYIEKL